MRVTCNQISDVLANLVSCPIENLFGKVIYLNVIRQPVTPDKLKFRVAVHVSAIVNTDDGGQYLLVGGEDCGHDYMDGKREQDGTKKALCLREALEDFCGERGWVIRPGVVSE
jgi:hypothetical protein